MANFWDSDAVAPSQAGNNWWNGDKVTGPATKTFDFTAPDGKKYSVVGPADATPEEAFSILQKQLRASADALHQKYYSDMPKADFDRRLGLSGLMSDADVGLDPQAAANFKGGQGYGFTDQLMHSATAGLARPLYGAVAAIGPALKGEGFWPAYAGGEHEYDAAKAAYERGNSGAALTGSLLGGAAALGGAGGLAKSFLGRVAQGAATGAGYGGVEGTATANGDLGERLAAGAKGAGYGAAIGAAIPVGFDALRLATAIPRSMLSAAVNPEGTAARQIAQGMSDAGITPQAAARALAEARAAGVRDMTLADVAGRNVAQRTATYAKTPSAGKDAAMDFLAERAQTRGENIVDAARPGLGNPEAAYATIDAKIAEAGTKAKPLYERSYNTPLDTTRPEYDAIMAELNTPTGQQALAGAARKMADEKIPSKMIHINVAQDGTVSLSRLPDTRTLDYVKRALDDKIETALRGGNRDDARILQNIRGNIVDNLDVLNPAFRSARQAFAGPMQAKGAIEQGMDFLTMPPEEIRKVMTRLSAQGVDDFARLGAARALKDIAGASSDRTRQLLSGNMRDRMAEIFPDQRSYDRAFKAWETIKRQNDLGRKVLGGSPTYENFADAGDAMLDPGVLLHAVKGNIPGATVGVLRGLANRFGGITPEVAKNGLGILLTPDPAKQIAALGLLQNAATRRTASANRLGILQRGATGAIVGQLTR